MTGRSASYPRGKLLLARSFGDSGTQHCPEASSPLPACWQGVGGREGQRPGALMWLLCSQMEGAGGQWGRGLPPKANW